MGLLKQSNSWGPQRRWWGKFCSNPHKIFKISKFNLSPQFHWHDVGCGFERMDEVNVLRLSARGLNPGEIAEALGEDPGAVAGFLGNVENTRDADFALGLRVLRSVAMDLKAAPSARVTASLALMDEAKGRREIGQPVANAGQDALRKVLGEFQNRVAAAYANALGGGETVKELVVSAETVKN